MAKEARKAQVTIGNLEIEGYQLLDTGKFGMSQTQLMLWSGVTTDTRQAAKRCIQIMSSKTSKTLVPQGFVVHPNVKVTTEKEEISLVELDSVSPLLTVCVVLGHTDAAKPLATLAGLALHELFCDAFEIETNKQQRQEYLKQRTDTINFYHEFDVLSFNWWSREFDKRSYGIRSNYEIYLKAALDKINTSLFGKTSKEIKKELGISDSELIRDYFNNEALRRVSQIECIAANQMTANENLHPYDAVVFALNASAFSVIDYRGGANA